MDDAMSFFDTTPLLTRYRSCWICAVTLGYVGYNEDKTPLPPYAKLMPVLLLLFDEFSRLYGIGGLTLRWEAALQQYKMEKYS